MIHLFEGTEYVKTKESERDRERLVYVVSVDKGRCTATPHFSTQTSSPLFFSCLCKNLLMWINSVMVVRGINIMDVDGTEKKINWVAIADCWCKERTYTYILPNWAENKLATRIQYIFLLNIIRVDF